MSAPATPRNRRWLCAALLAVIGLGLASRNYPGFLPSCLGKYPGDALWAVMVYLGWGILRPGHATAWLASLALGTSYAVEFSQLYQAPWLNAIRQTTAGHWVLGSGFSWLDMAAYTVGVTIVACADLVLQRAVTRAPASVSQLEN